MPWTKKQERYMWANHPDVAKKVMNEPGYATRAAGSVAKGPGKKSKGKASRSKGWPNA